MEYIRSNKLDHVNTFLEDLKESPAEYIPKSKTDNTQARQNNDISK